MQVDQQTAHHWRGRAKSLLHGAVMDGATFNFFGSLFGGLIMFCALFAFARWATATDPQILRILLNSAKFRRLYDPAKRAMPSPRRGIDLW
jgi:hypothetical protein